MIKESKLQKSGFKTKNAAFIAGQKAYEVYQNGGCKMEGYKFYGYFRNFVKVIKCSFRVATDILGFITFETVKDNRFKTLLRKARS